MSLVRHSSHGNGISVLFNSETDEFSKISFTPKGGVLIQSEKNGIEWYAHRLDKSPEIFISHHWDLENYQRINLKRISGLVRYYKQPIGKHKYYLESCIDHYLSIWPKGPEDVPCHGDLTLDNILFSPHGPVFFDWEHFSSNGHEWGFDIAYLILSSISLPYTENKRVPNHDLRVFSDLWNKLVVNGLPRKLAKKPFDYFNEKFQESQFWKQIIDDSPRKMFPSWLDNNLISAIHSITSRSL